MYNIAAVFIGGGLGSVVRYSISALIKLNFKTQFPLATFFSNVLSCLILASTVLLFNEKITSQPTLRLFLIVGFCGGFSTFSSFSLESIDLVKSGNISYAIVNVLLSFSVCFSLLYILLKNH